MTKKTDEPEPTFETALAELEETVRQLEDGEKSLDEGLALYERGVKALRNCHVMLDKAERRIRALVESKAGSPVLKEIEAIDKLVAGSDESTEKSGKSAKSEKASSKKTLPKPKPVDSESGIPDETGEEGEDLF